jgi:hypothetical protein
MAHQGSILGLLPSDNWLCTEDKGFQVKDGRSAENFSKGGPGADKAFFLKE